eukprot:11845615-Alexandrium_andersonii.AAC.1
MAPSNGNIVTALGTSNSESTLTQAAGLGSNGSPSLEDQRRPTPREGTHSDGQHSPGLSPASNEVLGAVTDPGLTLT